MGEKQEEQQGPLWDVPTDEMIDEIRRRFPVGFIFLLRRASKGEEFISPWWGNVFTVYGLLVRAREMVRNSFDSGLWMPNALPFPDDRIAAKLQAEAQAGTQEPPELQENDED